MATFQKKTSDLLKEQKASYPKMVKSALKGKTGLTRAQVKKTIKGVAKDYRKQYGATRRERYLNAVKQVASTMPKATKTTKTKAKAAVKPKTATKSKQNAKALEHLRKRQEAVERKAKARSERIRQRTKAAFANYQLEHAKEQAKINKAIKSLTTQEKDNGSVGVMPPTKDKIAYKPTSDYNGRAWYKDLQKRKDDLEVAKYEPGVKGAQAREDLKALPKEARKRNISELSAQTGLSTKQIEALYKICDKDKAHLRPVFECIFFDANGYAVATDAHKLVAVKCKVPKALANKLIHEDGQEQEGRYPAWRMVMPFGLKRTVLGPYSTSQNKEILAKKKLSELEFAKLEDVDGSMRLSDLIRRRGTMCRYGDAWLTVENLAPLHDLLKASGSSYVVFEDSEISKAVGGYMKEAGVWFIVMPMLPPGELPKDLLDKYVPRLKK